jgi:site-specific DNA-methyltransferase (adenine-specific)
MSMEGPARPVDIILAGDCREVLATVEPEYFSACITDPPYNYEFVGRDWNSAEIDRRVSRVRNSKTLVKNIPYGSGLAGGVRNARWYQRVRENILEYQAWCVGWGRQVFRTLRPGAFVLVFNSTRTVAHVQVALEEAGFYTRDVLVYRRHAGIPKGLNAASKLQALGDKEFQAWEGWHSCLRNEWEAICLLQKPLAGNYLTTIRRHKVGLLRAEMNGSGFLSNIIENFKRSPADNVAGHCTVKPLELMTHLVRLTVPDTDRHVVLDPFAGTGTTCLAARELGHHYVGIEINPDYCRIAESRLAAASTDTGKTTSRVAVGLAKTK